MFWVLEGGAKSSMSTVREASLLKKKILRKKRREQHIESSLDNDVLQLRLAIRS